MDREEILAKSRKENDLSDERTKYIGLKGANFAITILIPCFLRKGNRSKEVFP